MNSEAEEMTWPPSLATSEKPPFRDPPLIVVPRFISSVHRPKADRQLSSGKADGLKSTNFGHSRDGTRIIGYHQTMLTRSRLKNCIIGVLMLGSFAGWAVMLVTQQIIFSADRPHCAAYSAIELKGTIYRTCSYLANSYTAGQWTFFSGFLIAMIAEWKMSKSAASRHRYTEAVPDDDV